MCNTESKDILVFLVYEELLQINKKNIENPIEKKGQKAWIGSSYTHENSRYLLAYENTIDVTQSCEHLNI